eukprot:gene14141-biopygen15644
MSTVELHCLPVIVFAVLHCGQPTEAVKKSRLPGRGPHLPSSRSTHLLDRRMPTPRGSTYTPPPCRTSAAGLRGTAAIAKVMLRGALLVWASRKLGEGRGGGARPRCSSSRYPQLHGVGGQYCTILIG